MARLSGVLLESIGCSAPKPLVSKRSESMYRESNTIFDLHYLIILIFTILLSCNTQNIQYESQIKTANKLLEYFKKEDSNSVRSMLGIKSRYLSEDLLGLEFKVRKASKLLHEYGIPNSSSFVFKEYKEDYRDLEIIIPIIKGQESDLKEAYISVSFSQNLSPQKIASFEVYTESNRGLLIAPDALKR